MAKKLSSSRTLLCTLLVLTFIVIFIACGSGEVIEIGTATRDIDAAEDRLVAYMESDEFRQAQSSSSEEPGNGEESSSSEEVSESSSSDGASGSSSSGEGTGSSASESPYILTCDVRSDHNTGNVGKPINDDQKPIVTCKEKATEETVQVGYSYISFKDGPTWYAPVEGIFSNIQAEVTTGGGGCKGLIATCTGTFTICPSTGCGGSSSSSGGSSSSSVGSSSSSSVAPSSNSVTITCTLPNNLTAGTTLTNNEVRGYITCSNSFSLNANPTFTGSPTAPISTNRVVAAANNYTNIRATANCGTNATSVSGSCNNITITASSSSSGSSSSGGGSSSYCTTTKIKEPDNTSATSVQTDATDAVCFKIQGSISGWNGFGVTGRSCTVNGTTVNPTTAADNANNWANLVAVSATSDGYIYMDCSGGSLNWFGISFWR